MSKSEEKQSIDDDGLQRSLSVGAKSAIVFIHGLESNSRKCWGITENLNWPNNLGINLNCDILLFQYRNRINKSPKKTSLPLENISDILRKSLLEKNYEKYYFISHSFGGIVAKSLIVNLANSSNASCKGLLDKICAISAISCPNYGHKFASFLGLPLFKRLRSDNMKILSYKSDNLLQLHADFCLAVGRIPKLKIQSIAEKSRYGLIFRVPMGHAYALGGEKFLSEKNHFGICDALIETDVEYRAILSFFERRIKLKEVSYPLLHPG